MNVDKLGTFEDLILHYLNDVGITFHERLTVELVDELCHTNDDLITVVDGHAQHAITLETIFIYMLQWNTYYFSIV